MPCDCRRFTIRYACRHKEREFYRCWRYNFKKNHTCLGGVLGGCEYWKHRLISSRVCNDCLGYFKARFGKKAAHQVPYESYISAEELAMMGARTAARSLQPFRPVSPMDANRLPSHPPSVYLQETRDSWPVISRYQPDEPRLTRPEYVSATTYSREKNPIPRKPSPVRRTSRRSPGLATSQQRQVVQSNEQALRLLNSGLTGRATPEHGSDRRIVSRDSVGDDEGDAEPGNGSCEYSSECSSPRSSELDQIPQDQFLRSVLFQPKPRRTGPILDKMSDSSLVKRLNQVAIELGLNSRERKRSSSVPRIDEAPKVPAWRSLSYGSTHKKEAGDKDGAAKKGKKTHSAPSSSRPVISAPIPVKIPVASPPARSVSDTYMVRTVESTESLRTKSAPRAHTPTFPCPVPPPRTARISNFRERGVPSTAYLEEENNDSGDEKKTAPNSPAAMLVSVSTPSPNFSCAVQSCFCDPEDGNVRNTCPSCRARRKLERQLQSESVYIQP